MKKGPEMDLTLKEAKTIELTMDRRTWIEDPAVSRYIYLNEKENPSGNNGNLTNFKKFFEIYDSGSLVGDIKIFYATEDDILNRRAQVLMVIGDRNRGIGTHALALLIEREKSNYNSLYCEIQRGNVASLKILKRNGFRIDQILENRIFLSLQLK